MMITKNSDIHFKKLFLLYFILTTIVIIFSYCFFDKPIADFVNEIHLPFNNFLIAYTKIIPWIYSSALIGLLIYFFFRSKIQSQILQKGLVIYSLSIVLVNAFKDALKFIFGRDWPKTWYQHNLSLIHNHAYGFHWLHGSQGYDSFPSGHMSIITAAITALCIYTPKLRWLWISIAILMAFSLLFLDYHFLSDIIAGSFLGTATTLSIYRLIKK